MVCISITRSILLIFQAKVKKNFPNLKTKGKIILVDLESFGGDLRYCGEYLTLRYSWGVFVLEEGVIVLFYFSIPNLIFDFSVFIVCCSFPSFPILIFSYILISIRESECSLTMFFPLFPFPFILFSIIR